MYAYQIAQVLLIILLVLKDLPLLFVLAVMDIQVQIALTLQVYHSFIFKQYKELKV